MIRNFPQFCSHLIGRDRTSSNVHVPQSEYTSNCIGQSIRSGVGQPIPDAVFMVTNKGETMTRLNGNVSFFVGKRLQNF